MSQNYVPERVVIQRNHQGLFFHTTLQIFIRSLCKRDNSSDKSLGLVLIQSSDPQALTVQLAKDQQNVITRGRTHNAYLYGHRWVPPSYKFIFY